MPTVTLNKTVFEKLVGKKLSDDKLKDRISMLGTDLESIEGDEINVEIFPNRPDMLSEQGFARAFSSFIGVKTGLRTYSAKKSGKKVVVDGSAKMRPFTACAIVKGVTFDDERIREIMQTQEKLAKTHGRDRKKSAYGLYPTDNVTFPIKYTTKDPKKIEFWPLGMPKPMRGDDVEELHPKGIEYKWVADAWRKEGYTKYPVFMDSADNIMCLLPYTNSHDTGKVEETTKEVFIECTGTDFNNVSVALNIFVSMLADMGGEVLSVDIEYPEKTVTTPLLEPKKMKVDHAYINKNLGLSLSEKEIGTLLERMGYGYDAKSKSALIPPYRGDILHQVDLIEDIAIAYGYENFEETIPKVATIGQESKQVIFERNISQLLIGLGLVECYSYNIASDTQMSKAFPGPKPVMLANSLSEEFNCLRSNMVSSLLDIFARNRHNEFPQSIFDIGTVFSKDTKQETGVLEQNNLAAALCGEDVDFTRIKQVLDFLFDNLDATYELKEVKHPGFMEGRVGKIIVNKKEIGIIGEIHPQAITNFGIEYPIVAFELNVTFLRQLVA